MSVAAPDCTGRENKAMYLRLHIVIIAKVVKIIETAKSFCINI